MNRRLSCVCMVVTLLGPALAHGQFDTQPGAAPSGSPLGEAKTQKWEFGVSIRAIGGPCAGLVGSFPIPSEWREQQVKVVNEQVTPQVRRTSYRDSEGLRQLIFEVPQLGVGETASCFITLEVTKSSQTAPDDPSGLVIPKNPPKDIRKFLGPSPLVESTNAKVKSLAKDLVQGKATAWEQVAALQAGVREHVKYDVNNKAFIGAAGALREGQADKEDLTATFVALCRAAKIPARMVWVLDYCYAEFYLEDADGKGGWYPCVVHEDVKLGSVTDKRPILEKGDNFKVPEKKDPQRFVAEHLTGKGGGGKPEVEFRRKSAE